MRILNEQGRVSDEEQDQGNEEGRPMGRGGDGYGSTLWLAIAEVTLADGMTLRSRDDALEHLRALARAMGYDV